MKLFTKGLEVSILALLTMLAMWGSCGLAHATTFYVTTNADGVDLVPGNGLCDAGAGQCSLRAAIMEANLLPGTDEIRIRSDIAGPIVLTIPPVSGETTGLSGDLDVTDDVEIFVESLPCSNPPCPAPPPVVIDGSALDPVFQIHPRVNATISGAIIEIIIQKGLFSSIFNEGALTLIGVTVTATAYGDGIENASAGTLTVKNSTVRDNDHDGIFNEGSATVLSSTVTGNRGHGIVNEGFLELFHSTVNANAGIDAIAGGLSNDGNAFLLNTTVSGHQGAFGRAGLGIANIEPGFLTVASSTVTNNVDPGNLAGGIRHFAIFGGQLGGVVIRNSIIAKNSPSDCFSTNSSSILSFGNNLDSDNSCHLTSAGDLPAVDPKLSLLQDNGGPTLTHGLLVGSPAIDAGADYYCPPIDQRGSVRPEGPHCDIGAVEGTGDVTPFLAKKTFAMTLISDSGQENRDCFRFESDNVLVSDTFGSGTWFEGELFGVTIPWSGSIGSSRGPVLTLSGSAFPYTETLGGTAEDGSRVQYRLTGVEDPDCRVE